MKCDMDESLVSCVIVHIIAIKEKVFQLQHTAPHNATLSSTPADAHLLSFNAFNFRAMQRSRILEPLLSRQIKVPLQHLLENTFRACLDNVSVAGNQSIEVPLVNSRRARRKCLPIARARAPPNHPLLRQRLALRTRQQAKYLGQDPRIRIDTSLAELLRGRAVEHVVCFDQGSGRAVVEHDFLVRVRVHVFPVELGVEFGGDRVKRLRGAEEVCEWDVFFGLVFCAQFGECLGA